VASRGAGTLTGDVIIIVLLDTGPRLKSIIFDTVPCLKSITRDGSYVTSTTRASRREGRLKKTRAGEGDADERDRANEERHD